MFADIPVWALPVLLVPIIPNLWSIMHLYKHEFPTQQERAAWIVAQVILPVLGGVGYILFGRKRALKK
ncbi:PLDc N-terminal domain-containing protein [Desulfomicrobium salsuginis]